MIVLRFLVIHLEIASTIVLRKFKFGSSSSSQPKDFGGGWAKTKMVRHEPRPSTADWWRAVVEKERKV
jgi:hypothetical protein